LPGCNAIRTNTTHRQLFYYLKYFILAGWEEIKAKEHLRQKKFAPPVHIFRSQKGAYLYILQSHKNAMGK